MSSCMANAKPGCPYTTPEEKAQMIEEKTGKNYLSAVIRWMKNTLHRE